MPRKKKSDHCVMRNGHPFCTHCGQSYVINLPAPIPVVTGAINGFVETHKNCEKTWTEPVADQSQSIEQKLIFWYKNGERGISSNTMFANFVNLTSDFTRQVFRLLPKRQWHHPCDPDDFYRCHKLLETVPELRAHLDQLREISPVWNNLVDNWPKLTEMLEEQLRTRKTNGMYEFMKELGC